MEQGLKVGYFKPIGWEMARGSRGEKIDEDAMMMVDVLGLNTPLELVSPLIIGPRFLEEITNVNIASYEDKIFQSFYKVSEGMDAVLIEGPNTLGMGASLGLDPAKIASRLSSTLILVSRADSDVCVDQLIWSKGALEATHTRLFGAILNCVPKTDIERVKAFTVQALEKKGITVLGIIPENISLRAPTVREICDKINCSVLTGESNLNNLVEDFLVGAMTPESALSYFRRSVRKAVITGGDRTDIQLTALQTDLSALILTGNYYPDVRVLIRAEELGVPVLLVPNDTYTTVKEIMNITGRIKSKDSRKIELARNMVEGYVDWRKILGAISQNM
jgi:BioD-like phosphotransacetylase family protein